MAVTVENLPIRVRALLGSRGADVSNLRANRILALVPTALRLLAQNTMKSNDPVKRNLLRKSFPISAVNGEVSLTTHLTAAEPLLLDGLRRATITFDGVPYAAQYKADRSSMTFPSTSEFIYWTMEDTNLLVADFNGLGVYTNDGDIRNAPYVPLLTNAHVQATLDADLVLIVTDLASQKAAA